MTVYNFGTVAVDIHLLKIISNYIAATYATMSILLAGKLFHANEFRVISDGVWSVVHATRGHEHFATAASKTIIVPKHAARTKWPCTNGHTCVP